jgi:hypothetical protein
VVASVLLVSDESLFRQANSAKEICGGGDEGAVRHTQQFLRTVELLYPLLAVLAEIL